MNILVIAHDATMYGASQSLLTALAGIKNKGNRNIFVILPYGGKIENELTALNINYQILGFPRCVEAQRRASTLMRRLKKTYHYYKKVNSTFPVLSKIIREFKPDVIYTNTSVVSIGYSIAKKLRIPHVWHIREFGDLDYNFIYFPTKHHIRNCIRQSNKSIFGSEALRQAWLASKDNNGEVVYNGIFDGQLRFEPKSLSNDTVRIGILGGIMPGKRQDIAIKSIASITKDFPNCSLFIYGDVMDKLFYEGLLQLVQQLDINDRIFFKGFNADKDAVFNNLDVVLSCSKMEGFGRTIVEAMMRGIPVIGNDSGGVSEIIDDKINGLLFQETDDSLSRAIKYVLSNPEIYQMLSRNGIVKAKKFSIPAYVESIDKILVDASRYI